MLEGNVKKLVSVIVLIVVMRDYPVLCHRPIMQEITI